MKMNLFFKNYGITLSLPNGTKLYRNEDILKLLNIDSKVNCVTAFAEEKSNIIFVLNFLGNGDKKEFDDTINGILIELQNKSLVFDKIENLVSSDSRAVLETAFDVKDNKTILVFVYLKNKIFQITATYQKKFDDIAKSFALNVAKSIV